MEKWIQMHFSGLMEINCWQRSPADSLHFFLLVLSFSFVFPKYMEGAE